MAELDQGYKNLINVILNLNHDRYKSYFNYFIILHLGLIAAIGSENYYNKIQCLRQFLVFVGIILAIAWFLVHYKIQRDIKEAWQAIENYEKSDKYFEVIKISDARWKGCECLSASKLMLVIPICFFLAYFFIFFNRMCS